jgi:hypothetical protein
MVEMQKANVKTLENRWVYHAARELISSGDEISRNKSLNFYDRACGCDNEF